MFFSSVRFGAYDFHHDGQEWLQDAPLHQVIHVKLTRYLVVLPAPAFEDAPPFMKSLTGSREVQTCHNRSK